MPGRTRPSAEPSLAAPDRAAAFSRRPETVTTPLAPTAASVDLAPLAALVEEIAALKRVRAAHLPDRKSWAAWRFESAWERLIKGESPVKVAVGEAARAVAAARLGAIHPTQLVEAELTRDQIVGIFQAAIREQSGRIAAGLLPTLLTSAAAAVDADLVSRADEPIDVPRPIAALDRQPRAGATCPGRGRILLDPPESHAEHCYVVAVCGVLASARTGGDPAEVFLFGLGHHLHNATLADSGFAGEVLLGEHLGQVLDRLFANAYETLPSSLCEAIERLRTECAAAETSTAKAFHIADVLDRVAEMRHFQTAATFEARTALEDLELVHEGPTQAFGQQVLRDADWWEASVSR